MPSNNKLPGVPTLLVGKQAWFRGNNVAELLGYAQPRVAITKLVKGHTKPFAELVPRADATTAVMKDDPRSRYLDTEAVKMLCRKSAKPQSVGLAQGFGVNLDDFKCMLHETRTLAVLTKVFRGEDIRLQFTVGPYRLDMYLPAYKIAIECDENNHKYYDKQHDAMRSQYISKSLGCVWIRFDPDAHGFSVLAIANQLFSLIKYANNKLMLCSQVSPVSQHYCN